MTNVALAISLEAAVPLWMLEIKQRGRAAWWSRIEANRDIWMNNIAERGDVLQYGGGKKGEVAKLFNELAEALAHMAFMPGGVRFGESHWEGKWRRQRSKYED